MSRKPVSVEINGTLLREGTDWSYSNGVLIVNVSGHTATIIINKPPYVTPTLIVLITSIIAVVSIVITIWAKKKSKQ